VAFDYSAMEISTKEFKDPNNKSEGNASEPKEHTAMGSHVT